MASGRKRFWWAILVAVELVLAAPPGAGAVEPDEILPDAKLESRARDLSAELRCLVCQNQSIDDSNAPLARDLRLLVRERLKAGDSDRQVKDYVVARYGDFVLLRPPLRLSTLLLWLAPLLVLGLGIAATLRFWRRAKATPEPSGDKPLTAEEQRRLEALLTRASEAEKRS